MCQRAFRILRRQGQMHQQTIPSSRPTPHFLRRCRIPLSPVPSSVTYRNCRLRHLMDVERDLNSRHAGPLPGLLARAMAAAPSHPLPILPGSQPISLSMNHIHTPTPLSSELAANGPRSRMGNYASPRSPNAILIVPRETWTVGPGGPSAHLTTTYLSYYVELLYRT